MKFTHLSKDQYCTTEWSGGTTTQLAICPPEAVYANRDFLWRISSATVDLEESEFTNLPDYHRFLATLQGTITLDHKSDREIVLSPYEVYEFDGGIPTHSVGKCTDFNLMLRKGKLDGSVDSLRLSADGRLNLHGETALIYCTEGSCTVLTEQEHVLLLAGESLLIEQAAGSALTLCCQAATTLMVAQMWNSLFA